jgi:hypothetical protein
MLNAATDALGAWVDGVAPSLAASGERREARRSFEELLEKSANELLRGGSPVAALVLSRTGGRIAAHEDVRRIRSFLRATDVVGITQSGDIGGLLADANRRQAESVANRLPTLLQSSPGDEPAPVRIGISTREPGEPAMALVKHARERAWSDSGRN